MSDDLLTIGQVTAPWGNKGEVKVFPLTDFPDRFTDLETVFWVRDQRQLKLVIERTRKHKDMLLMKIAGVDSINDAEGLRQGYLCIPKEQRQSLPEGHYYLYEIVGLSVQTVAGECLGTVKDILRTGSNDVYVIQRDGNGQDLLLPALKSVVLNIDTAAGTMTVEVPEGLE